MRIDLTGSLALRGGVGRLGEGDLPGRQGRLLLAYLVTRRQHPVPKVEVAEAVWGQDLPPSWESVLAGVASRLRRCLRSVAGAEPLELVSGGGWFQLRLPADVHVDVEEAVRALDVARTALRRRQWEPAWASAAVAQAIARRPFLPGEELPWVEHRRAELREVAARALECVATVWLQRGETGLATQAAREATHVAPLDEASWRLLMVAQDRAGNRAEALATYQRLRDVLAARLGVDPAPESEQLYLGLLRR